LLKAAGQPFLIDDFSMGLDWTSNPAKVEAKWLVDAKNVNLTSTKTLEKRKGCILGGIGVGSEGSLQIANAYVTSIHEYRAPNGTDYFLATCGTALYYWATGPAGGWTSLKAGLTNNLRCSFAFTNGYCFVTNGTDAMFKLKNTTVYTTIGIAAPTVTPTVALGAVTYTEQEDSYIFSVANYYALRDTATDTMVAQTINLPYDGVFTGITLWLRKTSSPTGNMWLEIWTDDNGTPGVQVGSDSNVLDVSTVAAGGAAYELTFNDMPTLTASTTYWILVQGDYTIDGVNYIRVGRATTSTYPYGYAYRLNASSVVTYLGPDLYLILTYNIPSPDTLTGRYKWVYAYKTSSGLISNYSTPSDVHILQSQAATVTCAYSTNAEVTYIVLYRTFDMGPDEDPANITSYYKVSETVNDSDGDPTTIGIVDSSMDNELTTLAENNNTAPPLAKYLVVFQDRLIYANCPAEEDGGSLFMISKVGAPESCPSSNYHYFDRDDGNDITGIAMLADYLVVFKKNKIAVMTADFSEWTTISNGIGCIAPWAIITLTDKVIFISEEGVKCTDGRTIYDVGKKLLNLSLSGRWTEDDELLYSGVYYPEKKQFFLNISGDMMLAGHWLASLYMDITPEFAQQDIYAGWTYHKYDNLAKAFYTMGTFTDSNGITRVAVGTTDGYIYRLDHGYTDAGGNINIAIETGYFSLNAPTSIDKTIRSVNVTYAQSDPADIGGTGTVKMYVDMDSTRVSDYVTLTGIGDGYESYGYSTATYLGPGLMTTENFNMVASCTGKLFSFRFADSSKFTFNLLGIEAFYRFEGIR